jgi:hypothetical protein
MKALTEIQSRALLAIVQRFDAANQRELSRRNKSISCIDAPPHLLNGNSRRTLNALLRAGALELAPNNNGCWLVRVTAAGRAAVAA